MCNRGKKNLGGSNWIEFTVGGYRQTAIGDKGGEEEKKTSDEGGKAYANGLEYSNPSSSYR